MTQWFERLREERTRNELSQDQLAQRVGITRKSQQRYEAGESSPDIAYLHAIEAVGLDSQYILNGHRSSESGVAASVVKKAAIAAFDMVKTSGLKVSAEQFAQMLVAFFPTEKISSENNEGSVKRHTPGTRVDNSMTATGVGIVQVGGRVSMPRTRKPR